jgi:hypothetical protein
MRMRPINVALTVLLALVLGLGATDTGAARAKKHRVRHAPAAVPSMNHTDDGTPIIMNGYHPTLGIPDIMREEKGAPVHAMPRVPSGRRAIPRGSSTYIPPPVPSPNSPNSPPAAVLLQPPPPAVYPAAPQNSVHDRVLNCIHSAPLNAGIGNNPANTQAYIAQCAN